MMTPHETREEHLSRLANHHKMLVAGLDGLDLVDSAFITSTLLLGVLAQFTPEQRECVVHAHIRMLRAHLEGEAMLERVVH